jgi:hypothetical protein
MTPGSMPRSGGSPGDVPPSTSAYAALRAAKAGSSAPVRRSYASAMSNDARCSAVPSRRTSTPSTERRQCPSRKSKKQKSSTSSESSAAASSGSEAESGSRGGAHARRVGHRAGLRLSAQSARGDASPRNSWRSPSRPRIGLASSPLPSGAGRTGAAASRPRAISHSIGPAPCPRGPSSGQGVAPRTRHIADATVTSAVVRRPPERPAVMGRPAGPSERETFSPQ